MKRSGEREDDQGSSQSENSTFAVTPTSRFNGHFPNFNKREEIGHFSLKGDRSFVNDDSRLRYYHPPQNNHGLNFDLREGFDVFVKRDEELKERLNNLLKWILSNKNVFHDAGEKDDSIERYTLYFLKNLTTPNPSNSNGWLCCILMDSVLYSLARDNLHMTGCPNSWVVVLLHCVGFW